MILDASVREQTYIEDCEVCCNPIEVSPNFEDGALIGFRSDSIDQQYSQTEDHEAFLHRYMVPFKITQFSIV